MFVIERTGVRRVRFDEGDEGDKWSVAINFQKFTRLDLDKFRLREFVGHVARECPTEIFSVIRLFPFRDQEFSIIGNAFNFVIAQSALERFFDGNPIFETALSAKLLADMPVPKIAGAIAAIANQLAKAFNFLADRA